MPIDNVLHIANFTRYISAEYLGTTKVDTATAALNVADPSTGDEGENGNCAHVYFCEIFPWNISDCPKRLVFDIYKVIVHCHLSMYV